MLNLIVVINWRLAYESSLVILHNNRASRQTAGTQTACGHVANAGYVTYNIHEFLI